MYLTLGFIAVMYVLHQIYVSGMYTLHQISVSALYDFPSDFLLQGCVPYPLLYCWGHVLRQIYDVSWLCILHQISVSALYAFCVPYPRLIFLECTCDTRFTLAGCLLYTRFLFLDCTLPFPSRFSL